MVCDNLEVDKLLKLKPQPADIFYPTLPTYEEELEDETEDEGRQREQLNERLRVGFENECKVIEKKRALEENECKVIEKKRALETEYRGTRPTQRSEASYIYHWEQKQDEPTTKRIHTHE